MIRIRAAEPDHGGAGGGGGGGGGGPLTAFQTFVLQVRGPNTPPEITTTPAARVTAGAMYRYDIDAIDIPFASDPPDPGDPPDAVRFELHGAPAGMLFDPVTGQLAWRTTAADVGSWPLTIRAVDERGAADVQSFVLEVVADTQPPDLRISLSSSVVRPTDSVTITVFADDPTGVSRRTLTINGTAQSLDAGHQAAFTPPAPGLNDVSASAEDAAGNVATAQVTLRVIDPTDTTSPVILVTSPQPGRTVTYLTPIVGSISDDHLESYRVEWSPLFADQWTTFFRRSFPQADGVLADTTLATFDPTLLPNDAYEIRFTATDLSGNSSTFRFELSVDGQARVGNFPQEFTDLTVPLAGLPITITRSYDTLMAAEPGDFGYGWMLGIAEGQIRETRPVTDHESLFQNVPFRTGTRVYINTPDGRRVAFTFDPVAEASLLGTRFTPQFTADPGVFERLEVEPVPLRQDPDGTFQVYFGGFGYNPRVYTLVTRDQVRYTYDQFDGLLSIQDRHDVRLTYSDSGIFSSTGASIAWTRDALGRITQITDPDGQPIRYTYLCKAAMGVCQNEDTRDGRVPPAHPTESGFF